MIHEDETFNCSFPFEPHCVATVCLFVSRSIAALQYNESA